jgi:DNA repair exonuclease SbcCD ATPase subunit
MENLVNALKVVTDSKDSKTKVARMKKETIEGLMKSIEMYNAKRSDIQEQLVRPTSSNLTTEQKQRIRKELDSRIEKRVSQIVELQQSLPTNEEYEKYTVLPGGIGWSDSTIVKNEDWEQNRRVMLQSDEVRKKLISDLQRSIERLEDQGRKLQKQMTAQPAAASVLEAEITRNSELLSNRQTQLDQALTEPEPAGRPIGKGEATALDEAVKVAVTGLRVEVTKLFADYTAFISFLPQVNALRAQVQQTSKS